MFQPVFLVFRVQLNVAGYEFYGQAELPQQAKHNAAVQALPIVRNLPDPTGTAAVVAKPAAGDGADPGKRPPFKQPPPPPPPHPGDGGGDGGEEGSGRLQNLLLYFRLFFTAPASVKHHSRRSDSDRRELLLYLC